MITRALLQVTRPMVQGHARSFGSKFQEVGAEELYVKMPWPPKNGEVSASDGLMKKTAHVVQEHLVRPILVGSAAAAFWTYPASQVLRVLDAVGGRAAISEMSLFEQLEGNFESDIKKVIEYAVWTGPLGEEILFRGLLQGAFNKVGSAIFKDKEVDVFSHKIKLAPLVSIVATSVLFGAVHAPNGPDSLGQVISAGTGGLTLGLLRHRFGLISSLAAHSTQNACAMFVPPKPPHILHENVLDVVI